ncbi:MAG: helix-turn-helix transcriptional regulator, partial [Candidatus Gallimonas sp.]
MTDAFEAKKLLIIRILQILNDYSDADHPLTQEEIIEKLYRNYGIEAERKAIGRNVQLLQDMFERDSTMKNATAIVIESDKRRGTYLDKRLFEDSELRLLIDGVLSSKYISENYSKDLIEKLCSLSNRYFRSHVKHVYTVKDWNKTENKSLFWNIEIIDEAIEKGRQITFDYNKYGADKKLHKTSSHTASPYQLILHNQRYYLVFFNERWKNMGHFRVDKMTNVKITEDPLTPLRNVKGYENGIDYNTYASALPYMFTDKTENVTFVCEDCIVDQVVDWFGNDAKIRVI